MSTVMQRLCWRVSMKRLRLRALLEGAVVVFRRRGVRRLAFAGPSRAGYGLGSWVRGWDDLLH